MILTEATHERIEDWKIRRAWQRLRDDPCTRVQVAPLNPGRRCIKLSASAMRLVAAEAMHYEVPCRWRRAHGSSDVSIKVG